MLSFRRAVQASWGNKVSEKGKELLGISDIPDETVDVSSDVLQRYRVTDHMELLEEFPLASMGAEDTLEETIPCYGWPYTDVIRAAEQSPPLRTERLMWTRRNEYSPEPA